MDTTQKRPKTRHLPRQSGVGMRTVKGPHPWRERLLQSRSLTPSQYLEWKPVPFFKGYGIAWSNAHTAGYDCLEPGCGRRIRGPVDDAEFMGDVLAHEDAHREAAELVSA